MKYLKLTVLFLLGQYCFLQAQDKPLKEKQLDGNGKITFAVPSKDLTNTIENEQSLLKAIFSPETRLHFELARTVRENNFIHNYYSYSLLNIEVEGADYVIHSKEGKILFANGGIPAIQDNLHSIADISFIQAKNSLSAILKLEKSEKSTTFELTDKGLVWFYQKEQLVLAYKIEVKSSNVFAEGNYFVDVAKGSLLGFHSNVCTGNSGKIPPPNAAGVAQTLYSGTQNFVTDDNFNGGFRLREIRNGVNILTLNANNQSNVETIINTATDFWDNDNNWQAFEHGIDRYATDVHWATQNVIDYWAIRHNRNSIDGNGMAARGYVHTSMPQFQNVNAFWDKTYHAMFYADGNFGIGPIAAFDVVSHEFGHGICQYTANLSPGTAESGALNEGFSDIWGACAEAFAAPLKQRWLIGEDIFFPCLRNLENPNDPLAWEGRHPDTYHGAFWDNGGEPHNNSTVLSHWFFLLSQGGNGTNDIGNAFVVNGIGIADAARIAYLTELFLNSNANYGMARAMSVQAVTQLFGQYSAERCSVENAWYAVGVGGLPGNPLNLSITGDWFVCPNGFTTYTLTGVPAGGNVTWNILPATPVIAFLNANGNQATVNYIADGNVTLTATVTNGNCWTNNVAFRYIELGEKTITNIIGLNPPLGVSPLELLELSVDALPNTPVQWTVEGGTILGNSTLPNVLIQVDQCSGYYVNGYLNVHCTFTHTCGTGTYTEWTTVDCSTGGGGPARVSPNPANNNITIDIQGFGKTIKEIKITDKMGNVLRQIKFSGINKKEIIDVSSLPSDIYYLQIFDGKTWTGKQISVRH